MIISRREFHRRLGLHPLKVIVNREEIMSVEKLYKEIVADAPFRNHSFMFDKKVDFDKYPIQEADGIQKKFPNIMTEGQRFKKIKQEILKDTYESVPILRDIDYPDVVYVNNGFHRIFLAHELGHKAIRVNAKYGKFILDSNISFNDLNKLLGMLTGLFDPNTTLRELEDKLTKAIKKKPEIGENHTIGFGSYKENSR